MTEIKYEIPDLNLRQLSDIFMCNRFFGGTGPSDYEAYALSMNYVRLVDILLREYENGRKELTNFLSVKNESLSAHIVIIAAGHFEMCISTLKRVTTYLEKIKGYPKVARQLKDSLPRNLSILNSTSVKIITDMRNAIVHLENRIQRGEITAGQSLCIFPHRDGLELGKHKIQFRDLALWIREAHDCSKIIVEYKET